MAQRRSDTGRVHQRLTRFFAVAFIALGISPFTAPFSTCTISPRHAASTTAQPIVTTAKIAADDSSAKLAVTFVLVPVSFVVVARRIQPIDRPRTARSPRPVPKTLAPDAPLTARPRLRPAAGSRRGGVYLSSDDLRVVASTAHGAHGGALSQASRPWCGNCGAGRVQPTEIVLILLRRDRCL